MGNEKIVVMYLNIITPCSRPENLHMISESINIPRENYRWIVVFDGEERPSEDLIPYNCEFYLHQNPKSRMGNSQRNFALNMCQQGHIYFQDDDTLMHPELWENVKDLNNEFITFYQGFKDGRIRLRGIVKLAHIDSHNYITKLSVIDNIRWVMDRYDADGIFAIECYKKSKDFTLIPKVLSIYNLLR